MIVLHRATIRVLEAVNRLLEEGVEPTRQKLADRLELSLSQVSRQLAKLRDNGLIKRVQVSPGGMPTTLLEGGGELVVESPIWWGRGWGSKTPRMTPSHDLAKETRSSLGATCCKTMEEEDLSLSDLDDSASDDPSHDPRKRGSRARKKIARSGAVADTDSVSVSASLRSADTGSSLREGRSAPRKWEKRRPLVEHYERRFEGVFGRRPKISAADRGRIDNVLSWFDDDVDEAKRFIDFAFEDEWIVDKGCIVACWATTSLFNRFIAKHSKKAEFNLRDVISERSYDVTRRCSDPGCVQGSIDKACDDCIDEVERLVRFDMKNAGLEPNWKVRRRKRW